MIVAADSACSIHLIHSLSASSRAISVSFIVPLFSSCNQLPFDYTFKLLIRAAFLILTTTQAGPYTWIYIQHASRLMSQLHLLIDSRSFY
jgi:hypothetical protein